MCWLRASLAVLSILELFSSIQVHPALLAGAGVGGDTELVALERLRRALSSSCGVPDAELLLVHAVGAALRVPGVLRLPAEAIRCGLQFCLFPYTLSMPCNLHCHIAGDMQAHYLMHAHYLPCLDAGLRT